MNDVPETDATVFSVSPGLAADAAALDPTGPGSSAETPAAPASPSKSVPDPEPADQKRGGGPKSGAGRRRSAWNSLVHGLTAETLFPVPLQTAIACKTAELTEIFEPVNDYERSQIAGMAKAAAQKEHASNLMVIDNMRSMERATICWDSDRREHIENLGAKLRRDPSRVAYALEQTKQGAEYKLRNWERLRWTLQANKVWSDEQESTALDLLGIELKYRADNPVLPPDADVAWQTRVVDREVKRLNALLEESLLKLDAADQACAKVGLSEEEDKTSRDLRKYEARAWRQYHAYKRELIEARTRIVARAEAEAVIKSAREANMSLREWLEHKAREDRKNRAPTPRPVVSKPAERYLTERWAYDSVVRYEPDDEDDELLDEQELPVDDGAHNRPPADEPPQAGAAPADPVSAPAAAEAPVQAATDSGPPVRKGNRRHRRAQERAARKAAHQQRR
jgi:hypothetical protein